MTRLAPMLSIASPPWSTAPMFRVGLRVVLIALMSMAASAARSQDFPSKPIRIVVPFGAGGIADLSARAVAQSLSASLGQSVIIDNKPGAGGVVAAEMVARADPDGHTLLLLSNANAVSAGLFRKLPYDTVRDFAPIGMIGTFDLGIVVAADSPFRSLDDLVAYARANPDKLNLGSINIGSTQHLAAELFKTSANLNVQVVPFNGTPAIVTALRGKQVDAAIEILGPMLPQIQSGAVRALAVAGEKRSPALPAVRTVTESGIAGFVVTSWNALAAPAKTPPQVVDRIARDLARALATPDLAAKLRQLNVEPKPGQPADVAKLLQSEIARWSGVIARAKIPLQ
jgi:tripartite-type tricarboxylate transporter receptor subunit TctC